MFEKDEEIVEISREHVMGTDGYRIKTNKKGLTSPKKDTDGVQVRDMFQTPAYATDLLIPFIPKDILKVWEPACGSGKISRQLRKSGYTVFESDIKHTNPENVFNFLEEGLRDIPGQFSIITNPPFSIKEMFVEKCFEYGRPFALLINADYSQQQIGWIQRGCEKIIPNARISYITPNVLRRIHEGEVWKVCQNECPFDSLKEMETEDPVSYKGVMELYFHIHNYTSIDDVPMELLFKYSSAQFHSLWLTYGFGLGRTETFVDLSVNERRTNI